MPKQDSKASNNTGASWIASKIEMRDVSLLKGYEKNARTHSEHQINHLVKQIKEFGFHSPLLVNKDNMIIAGHGRTEAAKRAGLKEVPVIVMDHLSERQLRTLVISDNQSALLAGWDFELLSQEISELAMAEVDLALTGFDEQTLDALLKDEPSILPTSFNGDPAAVTTTIVAAHERRVGAVKTGLTEDDSTPEVKEDPKTKPGDIWQLGVHRVMCGDSTNGEHVVLLMAGKKADMVFTDPPYNVKVANLGSAAYENSIGKIHGEFAMASGEMTEEEFTDFLKKIFTQLVQHSTDGSIHYVCMDWRHIAEMVKAAEAYTHTHTHTHTHTQ